MRLAAILGTCLLLLWPCAGSLRPAQPVNSQSAPQGNSSSQNPSDKPSGDAQKPPAQSGTPKTQTPATPACPDSSQTGSNANPSCKPKTSKATKSKTHHRTQAATPPAATTPEGPIKTVVQDGSTKEPEVALSPPVDKDKKDQQTNITNQLLAASDANLKKLSGRELNPSQQDTVTQIKSYIEQARSLKDDDVQRAYNLALKAKLLSEELAGK
jgi:hypothetical protein